MSARVYKNNYERYGQAAFNQLKYYPVEQSVDAEHFRPVAPWMGRLILPDLEQRHTVQGALFEVHHTPAAYRHLMGKVVYLRLANSPRVQWWSWNATRTVHFNDAAQNSVEKGRIHPERLNNRPLVSPLESLAGSRPNDDVFVRLHEPLTVVEGEDGTPCLYVSRAPAQISGRYYALVQFVEAVSSFGDQYRVAHYNRASQEFDGPQEVVSLPQVVANRFGLHPSTSRNLEQSPLNVDGWYIHGAKDHDDLFVVQALEPRKLVRLQPQNVIHGQESGWQYVRKDGWNEAAERKGDVTSVLVSPSTNTREAALAEWKEGDEALLLHVYGGVGGKEREPDARTGLYWGHFAFGTATVIREPIADELRFDIEYHQVYCHNFDGMLSGNVAWTRYMGDRQWGIAGIRPVCDILVKLDAFTQPFLIAGESRSVLGELRTLLEMMTARYRIGDGTGGTYVLASNNCAQDSNQTLYAAIKDLNGTVKEFHGVKAMMQAHPDQVERFDRMLTLQQELRKKLLPFGTARADWNYGIATLGSNSSLLESIGMALRSWRTMLPRLACNTIVEVFMDHGASVWALYSMQIGGDNPNIEPIVPIPS